MYCIGTFWFLSFDIPVRNPVNFLIWVCVELHNDLLGSWKHRRPLMILNVQSASFCFCCSIVCRFITLGKKEISKDLREKKGFCALREKGLLREKDFQRRRLKYFIIIFNVSTEEGYNLFRQAHNTVWTASGVWSTQRIVVCRVVVLGKSNHQCQKSRLERCLSMLIFICFWALTKLDYKNSKI